MNYPLVDATAPANRTASKMKQFLDDKNIDTSSVSITREADGQVSFAIKGTDSNTLQAPLEELANELGAKLSLGNPDKDHVVSAIFSGDKLTIRSMEAKLGSKVAAAQSIA
ncbi:MAG: hypothetical protein ACN2B6_06525 [Rickettsiales bacterium]